MPANQPAVPVVSRGLMYGDGIFETFRTYRGKTFLLKEHINRLQSGMHMLGMGLNSNLKVQSVRKLVAILLEKQQMNETDAIVRLQVWRDGLRGYHPQEESSTHFSITASACPDDFSPPILKTVERRRIPSKSMPSEAKFTNGINYILAAKEAAEKGGDDALMQTIDGFISESTIANIFWINGDTIFTPDNECDLIPGITREVILDFIHKSNRWNITLGKYPLSHIMEADAVWMCNSVREVLAVKQINEQLFAVDHPSIKELQDQFDRHRKANAKPFKSY